MSNIEEVSADGVVTANIAVASSVSLVAPISSPDDILQKFDLPLNENPKYWPQETRTIMHGKYLKRSMSRYPRARAGEPPSFSSF